MQEIAKRTGTTTAPLYVAKESGEKASQQPRSFGTGCKAEKSAKNLLQPSGRA